MPSQVRSGQARMDNIADMGRLANRPEVGLIGASSYFERSAYTYRLMVSKERRLLIDASRTRRNGKWKS